MTETQCNQPKYSIMDYFPKLQQHKGLAWRSSCRCENIPVSKFMVLKVPSILWNMQMAQHCTSTHPCWLFFQRQWNTSCPLIINSKDSKKHRNIFPMGFVRSNSLPSKRWYSKNPVMISNYIDSVSNQAVSSVFGIKPSLSFEWYKRGYQHQFRSLQVVNWFTIWSTIFKELKMFLMIRRVIQ